MRKNSYGRILKRKPKEQHLGTIRKYLGYSSKFRPTGAMLAL